MAPCKSNFKHYASFTNGIKIFNGCKFVLVMNNIGTILLIWR